MSVPSHVIIVGRLAPWEGPVPEGAELWGSARCLDLQKDPPLDVLFMLHDPEEWLGEEEARDYLYRVRSSAVRVIARRPRPELRAEKITPPEIHLSAAPLDPDKIPPARCEVRVPEVYPVRQVVERFGVAYFTSTMAWQIAYALYLGVRKITLHRVFALPASMDYFEQKPCLDFWAGVALGLGVKLEISGDSSIARPWPWQSGLYAWYQKLDPGLMGMLLKQAIQAGARAPVSHRARPEAAVLDGASVDGIHRYPVPRLPAERLRELAAEERAAAPRIRVAKPRRGQKGGRWR